MKLISESRSLDIFSAVRAGDWGKVNTSNHNYLPTWVPNYQNMFPYSRPFSAADMPSSFNASGSKTYVPHASSTDGTLVVQGKIIDQIVKLCPLNFEGAYYIEGIQKILQLEEHIKWVQFSPTENIDKVRAYVLRILLADGANGPTQPLPFGIQEAVQMYVDEDNLMLLRDRYENGEQLNDDDIKRLNQYKILCEISLIGQRKRVLLSGSGKLGLVSQAARRLDKIAIIAGSKTPVVLDRPIRAILNHPHLNRLNGEL